MATDFVGKLAREEENLLHQLPSQFQIRNRASLPHLSEIAKQPSFEHRPADDAS
jgi:hypothetical protein